MAFKGKDVEVRVVKKTQFLNFCGIKETKNSNSNPPPIRILQPLLVFSVICVREEWKSLSELACVCEDQGQWKVTVLVRKQSLMSRFTGTVK